MVSLIHILPLLEQFLHCNNTHFISHYIKINIYNAPGDHGLGTVPLHNHLDNK